MSIREFTGADGSQWTVWSTVPDWAASLPAELHAGWLTFECGTIRKRLTPIPRAWEGASLDRLRLYCAAAESLIPPRRSNPRDANPGERTPD